MKAIKYRVSYSVDGKTWFWLGNEFDYEQNAVEFAARHANREKATRVRRIESEVSLVREFAKDPSKESGDLTLPNIGKVTTGA